MKIFEKKKTAKNNHLQQKIIFQEINEKLLSDVSYFFSSMISYWKKFCTGKEDLTFLFRLSFVEIFVEHHTYRNSINQSTSYLFRILFCEQTDISPIMKRTFFWVKLFIRKPILFEINSYRSLDWCLVGIRIFIKCE